MLLNYKRAEPPNLCGTTRHTTTLVVNVYNTSLVSTAWPAAATSRMRACGGARRSQGEGMVVVGADPVYKERATCPHPNFLFKKIYLSLLEKRKFLIAKNRQETVSTGGRQEQLDSKDCPSEKDRQEKVPKFFFSKL